MDRHIQALEKLSKGTVIPANPLALDANRSFDKRRQSAIVRYYLDAGVGGLAVGVHTTQFAIRDPKIGLYKPVLELSAQEIDAFENKTGKTIVKIAGVCGDVGQAIGEAELAKEIGYDAVLLSPGGLAHLSEGKMIERTREIAKILPVVGFYLQPSVGGRLFSYEYWRHICDIEGVVAIKTAPFNRYQTLDVMRAVAMSDRCDKIAMYTGNDDNIVIDLLTKYRFTENGKTYEKAFVGGLLGHWCVWVKKVCEMYDMLMAEKKKDCISPEMLVLANAVTDLNAVFFDAANGFAGCIAGLHEVLRRQGLLEGIWCLDPEEGLSPGQSEELDRVYRMYPDLHDDAFVHENLAKWLGL